MFPFDVSCLSPPSLHRSKIPLWRFAPYSFSKCGGPVSVTGLICSQPALFHVHGRDTRRTPKPSRRAGIVAPSLGEYQCRLRDKMVSGCCNSPVETVRGTALYRHGFARKMSTKKRPRSFPRRRLARNQLIRTRLIPTQRTSALVFGDPCFEEVLFLRQVDRFAHPGERIR